MPNRKWPRVSIRPRWHDIVVAILVRFIKTARRRFEFFKLLRFAVSRLVFVMMRANKNSNFGVPERSSSGPIRVAPSELIRSTGFDLGRRKVQCATGRDLRLQLKECPKRE